MHRELDIPDKTEPFMEHEDVFRMLTPAIFPSSGYTKPPIVITDLSYALDMIGINVYLERMSSAFELE